MTGSVKSAIAHDGMPGNASPALRDAAARQSYVSVGMPPTLRLIVFAMLVGLLAGAAYLIAVRGDAIFLDLAPISNFLLCL